MNINRRTALLGVAGGMIGGVPVAASVVPTSTRIIVLRDGKGGFVAHFSDGRIQKFAAAHPERRYDRT